MRFSCNGGCSWRPGLVLDEVFASISKLFSVKQTAKADLINSSTLAGRQPQFGVHPSATNAGNRQAMTKDLCTDPVQINKQMNL